MSFIINPYSHAAVGGSGDDFDYTNLLWRVRGDGIAGKSDGDSLNTYVWLDTSGNARNWTFSGGLYQTNEINGHPAVEFRGQANADNAAGPNLSGLGLSEIDLYAVVIAHADPASGGAAYGLWTLNDADYSNAHTQYPDTGGTVHMTAHLPSGQARLSVNPTPSLASWHLLRVTAKTGSNNYTVDVDGTNIAAGTRTALVFPAAPFLGKASDNGGTAYYWGMVAEWFALGTKADATQFGTIRDYVNDYYGLSVA